MASALLSSMLQQADPKMLAGMLPQLLSQINPQMLTQVFQQMTSNPQSQQVLKMVFDRLLPHVQGVPTYDPSLGADHPANLPAQVAASQNLPVQVGVNSERIESFVNAPRRKNNRRAPSNRA